MFVLSRDVSAAKKVIATLLATALVLWVSGSWNIALAQDLSNTSDLLSDSAPGADSDHTITFTAPSGVGTGQTVVVTFPAGFDLTGVTAADVDLEIDGSDVDTTGTVWSVAIGASDITFTSVTGTIGGASTTVIKVGTVADAGVNQINNPASPLGGNESFEIDISAGTSDSGHTRVVILDTVLITATVDTVFNFTVTGIDTGFDVNGATTNASSSSTTIPFGTLSAYTPVILAQDLQVESNAINGFVVTAQTDGPLESTVGADIDYFEDNVISTTPAAWSSPLTGLDIDDENTWGHWGITSEDATTTRGVEFGSNQWVGVDTTPVIVFSHDGPADDVTPGIGSTTVGFQVEISPLQEAADDYSTVLTYIATPTF